MKLTVLGATGGVGRQIVSHALTDGHEVTAVVRDPAGLTQRHQNLSVVPGNALDAVSITPAVAGSDAVLSGIGAAGRSDPLKPASASARAAVTAMTATGVKRIVVVSAAPLNRAGTGMPPLARRVAIPLLWRVFAETYADLELMERVLRDSRLDWTAVRPPRLTNGPGTARYRRTIEIGPPGGSIARADVARAMIDSVTDHDTIGHAVAVSR